MAKIILVDTDVIIHLSQAGKLSLLKTLFPGRVYFPDVVIEELKSLTGGQIDMMIQLGIVKPMEITSNDTDVMKEYQALRRANKGKGESACLALCRFKTGIVASSNTRDIVPYCATHGLEYLTTLDILAIAYLKGVHTVNECNDFIRLMLSKGSFLSTTTLPNHLVNFDQNKVSY